MNVGFANFMRLGYVVIFFWHVCSDDCHATTHLPHCCSSPSVKLCTAASVISARNYLRVFFFFQNRKSPLHCTLKKRFRLFFSKLFFLKLFFSTFCHFSNKSFRDRLLLLLLLQPYYSYHHHPPCQNFLNNNRVLQ